MKDIQKQQEKILSLLQTHTDQLSKIIVGMYGIPENRQQGIMEIVQDHEKRISTQEQNTEDFPFKPYKDAWTSGRTILAVLATLQISVMAIIALIVDKFITPK